MTEPPLDPDQPGFVKPGTPIADQPDDRAPVQIDYFGFSKTERFYFPDKVTYVDIQVMNEGAKTEFQKKTQRDVTLTRGSGDAKFSMDPSEERHALIVTSVVDWNLIRNGVPVPLSTNASHNKRNLEDFLKFADPALIEKLEDFIRKLNPWLVGEMSVEDIDKEIDRLKELREQTLERERGEGFSSSK